MNRATIEILEKLINDAEAHAKASESEIGRAHV